MWAGWIHHSWRFEHAEALGIVGPEMSESGSKTSTMPVVWANFRIFRHDPNDFLSRSVTMDETWLYHYDPEIKQQSMEWRHSGSLRPKKIWVQKSAEKLLVSIFFGIKTASSTLIAFQRVKLSTRSITHLCWCNWRTFWRKNAAGSSSRVSCSCTKKAPPHRALATQKKLAYLTSSVLITHPFLRILYRRSTTCSLDW